MTSCIYRWIVPNRVDRQILAVFFVWLMATAMTVRGVEPMIQFVFVGGFFGALFCVPAMVGTRNGSEIRKSIPLLLLTLMSLGLTVVLVGWGGGWISNRTWNNATQGLQNQSWFVVSYATFSIIIAAYFGILLASVAFSRAADWLLELQSITKQNRTRLLVYFVVILFLCSQVQKLFDSFSMQQNRNLITIGGAILFIPLTYMFSRMRRWWMRGLAFFLLFVVVALVLFSHQLAFFESHNSREIPMLAGATGYFVVLMLIWPPISKEKIAVPRRRWPSLWGYAAASTAILIVVASSLMDLSVAFRFGGRQGLEFARFLRQLQQTSGVVTQFQFAGNRWTAAAGGPIYVGIEADFSPKSDPTYFADFDRFAEMKIPVTLGLALQNINPNVETAGLENFQKSVVRVFGGCLSTQQLLDLINGSQFVYVAGCQFENSRIRPKTVLSQSWPQFLVVSQIPTGQLAIAVNALQTAGYTGRLQLQSCELNDDDWRALGGLQNPSTISVVDCPPPTSIETRVWLREQLADQKTIEINLPFDEVGPAIWSYFDINLPVRTFDPPFETDRETWDALFLGGLKLGKASEFLDKLMESKNFNQTLVDLYLVFDPEKKPDAIRYVLIPMINDQAVEKAASLKDLEILSFDADWINDSLKLPPVTSGYSQLNLQPLEKLKSLKELYFPKNASKNVYFDNYQLFAKLPNLEILQFDAFHDSRLSNVANIKAQFFPNLKHIRLFSEPHPKLLRELSKLGNLERIDLIDSEEWFEKKEDQEKLRSIFDKRVEVRFLKTADYPDPPDNFKQHLKQVEQDVRKRRLPGSE